MDKNGGDGPPVQYWAVASQASSALLGPVVLGIILDWQLGWTPVGTLTGLGVGLVSLMVLLIRMAKRSGE